MKGKFIFLLCILFGLSAISASASMVDDNPDVLSDPTKTQIVFYAKDINGQPTHAGIWELRDSQNVTIKRIDLMSQDKDFLELADGVYTFRQVEAKPGYEMDKRIMEIRLPILDQNGAKSSLLSVYTKQVPKVDEQPRPMPDPDPRPRPEPRPDPKPDPKPEPQKPPRIPLTPEDPKLPPPPIVPTKPYHTGVSSFDKLYLSLMAIGFFGTVETGYKLSRKKP